MPRFQPLDIKNLANPNDKQQFIEEFLNKECSEDDPIQLSDLYANKNQWGGFVLQELGIQQNRKRQHDEDLTKWKLKVVSDEWGNKLTEGDIVTRRIKSGLMDDKGQPIDPSVISSAKLDGSYNDRFTRVLKYKVDKKGCISCNFQSAGHFLNVWGLHSETGRTLTTREATSREPVDCPNGQKLHCHYWRYQEVTKEQYDKLPNLKKRSVLLRGIDDIELINQQLDDDKAVSEVKAEIRKQEIIREAKG